MAQQTTVTLSLGKADLQRAVTSVIEYLSSNPPQQDGPMLRREEIDYNLGLSVLFECLRATFD